MVEKQLAPTIKDAQALIYTGKIFSDHHKYLNPSEKALKSETIFLKQKRNYVSRGGDKLFSALKSFDLFDLIKDKTILDVGSSTGGFSHCLLNNQAKLVISLDVGYNQLAWQLRTEPRIISIEKTDIRSFDPTKYPTIDFMTADISFNSLAKLASYLVAPFQQKKGALLLLLVKPQFELPRKDVPTGGVVTDPMKRAEAVRAVKQSFEEQGLVCTKEMECPIPGKCGNKEYFILLEN